MDVVQECKKFIHDCVRDFKAVQQPGNAGDKSLRRFSLALRVVGLATTVLAGVDLYKAFLAGSSLGFLWHGFMVVLGHDFVVVGLNMRKECTPLQDEPILPALQNAASAVFNGIRALWNNGDAQTRLLQGTWVMLPVVNLLSAGL